MKAVSILVLLSCTSVICSAENIDPYNQDSKYSWGENVGWFNFEPRTGPGVHVYSDRLEGMVWAENIGWINLSPRNYGGVLNDGKGNLSGYAWGENVGWINFDPKVPGDKTDYGVKIDQQGKFSGYAWGENIGWIRFDPRQTYNVRTCVVTMDDLAAFASAWLQTGNIPANLDGAGNVDNQDFSILSTFWQGYCPDGWELK